MAYIHFNPNPMNKYVGDCTIRAISLLTNKKWDETYSILCSYGFHECDMPSSNAVWGKYLSDLGYQRRIIPNHCPYCYTVKEFCQDHPLGTFLLGTGSHVVTVIDGDYYDAWNSGDQVPIEYWF